MRGPCIYDHSRTTDDTRALPVSPSGSTEFSRLPGGIGVHGIGYAQRLRP
jgi:hypothetical protein